MLDSLNDCKYSIFVVWSLWRELWDSFVSHVTETLQSEKQIYLYKIQMGEIANAQYGKCRNESLTLQLK